MIVYKVGEGQISSGKIIGKETRWYTEGELDDAIAYANKTDQNIYRKSENNAYKLWKKNYRLWLQNKNS